MVVVRLGGGVYKWNPVKDANKDQLVNPRGPGGGGVGGVGGAAGGGGGGGVGGGGGGTPDD